MKTESITIQFDSDKLSAINIYIKEKGTTLEDEILKLTDAIYCKYVPSNVRTYIALRNGEEIPMPQERKPRKAKKEDLPVSEENE